MKNFNHPQYLRLNSPLFFSTFENKLINPANFYHSPENVLTDSRLNKKQKNQILQSWEFDARNLDVADDENMSGGPPSFLASVLSVSYKLNS